MHGRPILDFAATEEGGRIPLIFVLSSGFAGGLSLFVSEVDASTSNSAVCGGGVSLIIAVFFFFILSNTRFYFNITHSLVNDSAVFEKGKDNIKLFNN